MYSHEKGLSIRVVVIVAIAVCTITVALHYIMQRANYENAINSYLKFLADKEYDTYFAYPGMVRFAIGYVDNNSTPELFLAEGNGTADSIHVFTFDNNMKTIADCGSYSQIGRLRYFNRQCFIISEHGGTGYWFNIYYHINSSWEREIMAVGAINGNDGKCYWAHPYVGDTNISEVGATMLNPQYKLSVDLLTQNTEALLSEYNDEILVSYNTMYPITIDIPINT